MTIAKMNVKVDVLNLDVFTELLDALVKHKDKLPHEVLEAIKKAQSTNNQLGREVA